MHLFPSRERSKVETMNHSSEERQPKKWLIAFALILLIVLLGAGVNAFQDFYQIAVPSNPGSGQSRLYANSTTHKIACLNSDGSSCMPSSGTTCGTSQTVYGSPTRVYSSVYHNTSLCTMHVVVSTLNDISISGNYDVYSDAAASPTTKIVEVSQQTSSVTAAQLIVFDVLPGNYYEVTPASGSPGIDLWLETY